jgi:hypothetical protein
MRTAASIEAQHSETGNDNPENRKSQLRAERIERITPWRWQKGFCPNPAGRPKRDRAAEIAREVFEENPELVYTALTKALAKGNAYAFKELADRAYGKLVERKELTGANGGPLEFKETNESELNERIAQLERDLGLAGAIDEAGRIGSAQARASETAGAKKDTTVLP